MPPWVSVSPTPRPAGRIQYSLHRAERQLSAGVGHPHGSPADGARQLKLNLFFHPRLARAVYVRMMGGTPEKSPQVYVAKAQRQPATSVAWLLTTEW